MTTETVQVSEGIHYGMSREDYDAIDAANQSFIKKAHSDSPATARHEKLFPKPPTDSIILGQALHTLVLEPDEFGGRFGIWEGGRRAGKDYDAFKEACHGKIILTLAQDETARLMALSLAETEAAAALFERKTSNEVVMVWTDKSTGVLCKARMDTLAEDPGFTTIADIKSAASISTEKFARAIVDFGYDFQAAMYLDGAVALGLPNPNYLLAVIDNGGSGATPKPTIVNADDEPRHGVRIFEVQPPTIQRGRVAYRDALMVYKMCRNSGKWPAWGEGIWPIDAPDWALKGVETI